MDYLPLMHISSNTYLDALNALHQGNHEQFSTIVLEHMLRQPSDLILLNALVNIASQNDAISGEYLSKKVQDHYNHTKLPFEQAASGWRYAYHLERSFLANRKDVRQRKSVIADKVVLNTRFSEHAPTLDALSRLSTPAKLLAQLREFSEFLTPALNQDDFGEGETRVIAENLTAIFSPTALRIVIIGAGPIGLFLAHSLKRSLKSKVNILVIEKRTTRAGWKVPYSRNWLTHTPIELCAGVVDQRIITVFQRIGDGAYIGAPLNVLENLLLLGARDSGVRFLFDSDVDLSFVGEGAVDCVFDASGGHLDWVSNPAIQSNVFDPPAPLKVKMTECLAYGAGFDNFGIVDHSDAPSIEFDLLHDSDGYRRPIVGKDIPVVPMLKITGIPLDWFPSLQKFIRENNPDSKFYIWPGRLAAPINECLLMINVQPPLFNALAEKIGSSTPIMNCFSEIAELIQEGDRRLFTVLRAIAEKSNPACCLEPPFVFDPRVRLEPFGNATIYGRPLFPLGDSLFNGHPKVGNGLNANLRFAREIHDVIVASVVSGVDVG